MSDSPEAPAPSAPPVLDYSGSKLRGVREKKDISLVQIAESTRISPSILSALEEERFQDIPPARVYVRGFVRCYAEEVGLNPDDVCETYLPRWDAWQLDQPTRN